MKLEQLLKKISKDPECKVLPPEGLPTLSAGHVLPPDLKAFYELCGGVELFSEADYDSAVVRPRELVLANPEIIGEPDPESLTGSWYIVVRGMGDQLMTIDCAPERQGRCYDSFWDCHGVVGGCSIIARSFTSLLEQLYASRGEHWFWLQSGFKRLGDAYDDVPEHFKPKLKKLKMKKATTKKPATKTKKPTTKTKKTK
jgi:hypothetical protein